MKREGIDKRIGMPDVDAEWVRFEHEVIDQKKGLRKEEKKAEPTTKTCPFCQSEISIKATRCPHCTSELKK